MKRLPKFYKTVNRPYPPLMFSLFDEGFFNKVNWTKVFGFPYSMAGMFYIEGTVYYPNDFMVNFSRRFAKKLFTEKNYINHIKRETKRMEKAILQSVHQDFPSFVKGYASYIPTLAAYFICDDLIENKLYIKLLKKLTPSAVEEIMYYLNLPLRDNFSLQERLDLVRTKNLNKHVDKYHYLNCRFGKITPYTLAQVKKKKAELLKVNFLTHYRLQKKNTRKMILKAKKALGPKYDHLPEIMQFFVYYRTHRTDVLNMVFCQYYPQLKKLAESKGLTYKELTHCLVYEILEDKIPSKSELRKRMANFSLLATPTKEIIYTGAKSKTIYKKYNRKPKEVKQFRGNIVNPGLVKGRVAIVKNLKDLNKVKPGNILVASMTTPGMVPAMKLAAGIITDEGGITCHAAILARELKKPCLIATQIATKVLKDGDLVEINTQKGIVKKIK